MILMRDVQEWWDDEVWPQLKALNCPQLFPTSALSDYVNPDRPLEFYKREMDDFVKEFHTKISECYHNLPENEPVPVWCDLSKTVLTMRELLMSRILDAMDNFWELDINKPIQEGYYDYDN